MASSQGTASITYQKPGTQPPIYVAGTFSDPPWQAHEMGYTTDADGEHVFKKEVAGDIGSKIQYKFRVGEGDWWVLHENQPTVTDAAGNENHELEVKHPQGASDLPTGRGKKQHRVSTPSHEDTDGDAVSPKTVKSGDREPQRPVKKISEGPKQHLAPGSGTNTPPTYASVVAEGISTPTYAKVAAEVADSAALINKEKPETPVPDEEAGRIGYRRLSSTPIVEVANTAAEVADTARDLDGPKPIVGFRILPDGNGPYEFADQAGTFEDDEDEVGNHRAPLFSHECIGMYDDQEEDSRAQDLAGEPRQDGQAWADDLDPDNIDVNDPTLERFPSDRDEIIDTVRRLETGLNEDRAEFEGVPPSPVVGRQRRGTEDSIGDLLLSPIPVSPGAVRVTKGLDVPRSPRGSISSAHSSVASLQAIDEAEEHEAEEPSPAEETKPSPVVRRPGSHQRSPFSFTASDEDEGVALREATEPITPKARQDADDAPHGSDSLAEGSSHVPDAPAPGAPNGDSDKTRNKSPRIVIEAAEEAGPASEAQAGQDTGDEAGPSHGDAREGSSTGVDGPSGDSTRLRKTNTADPTGRRSSGASASIPTHKGGGWFKAFFRLLFVDLIGGFISKLCGGRRKT